MTGRFCASIHCMDGRVQEPIIAYLQKKYGADYVDAITEPGPCKILSDRNDTATVDSIMRRLEISVRKHGAKLAAISGHYDCAGNPCDETAQNRQVRNAVEYCRSMYPDVDIIGLWIGGDWNVSEIRMESCNEAQ